jgi:toxin-antitoxin system PIN domain toxin
MRALLDVNVLLALLDRAHVHHARARAWFSGRAPLGWASCPITENGFIRIISQPKYPQPITIADAISLLEAATSTTLHEFWPADVSLLDATVLDRSRVHGSRQLTDLYLLALVVQRNACLATFDTAIPLSAVPGAARRHLVLV